MEEMEFHDLLSVKTRETERVLRGRFDEYLRDFQDVPYIQIIKEAMEYSITAGGKRLRPLLMRETYALFEAGRADDQGKGESYLATFMTALEMIHTYSLVHDDLPAMDNDEYRRGKETTWKVYGDGIGVLTGDALMNSAFEIAFRTICKALQDGESAEMVRRLAKCGEILSTKAGVDGMLGGQVVDVEAEKKNLPVTMEKILFIHEKKTAALMESAMCIGALLGGATSEQLELAASIARKVGIAFQIQDDVLDVVGDSVMLGKPVGSDAENGKQTYVTLKGLEESQAEVERLSREAILDLQKLPGDHGFLEALILHLIYRKK